MCDCGDAEWTEDETSVACVEPFSRFYPLTVAVFDIFFFFERLIYVVPVH